MSHRAALPLALFLISSVPSIAPAVAQSNFPKDKPVASNAEQIKKFEDAIAPYVKKGETLPEAKKKHLAGLPQNQFFSSP